MATETHTADPVDPARAALDQAQRAADQARAALEGFKEAILGGDETVSAADYATAADQAEVAQLRVQAAALAVQTAQRAARLNDLDDLKAEMRRATGTQQEAADDYRVLVEIMQRRIERGRDRQRNVSEWTGRLRRAGIAEGVVEHGLSWSNAVMGRGDAVTVDGRRITGTQTAGVFIGAAARQAALNAGVRHLPINDHPGLRDDPERWITANY